MNFKAFDFFGSNRDDSEGHHKPEDNVKGYLKGGGIRNKSVNVGCSFSEDKPVASHDDKEIKHPKGPDVNEIEEKEES